MTQRFIVVEGPIGVGKTSLATRLAQHYGAEVLYEAPEENPFLDRFYREPRVYGLQVQLSFLLQRARQFMELRQASLFAPVRIADFMLEKDRLFARMNLDDDEYALYAQVYDRLAIEAPHPDLVVWLQAPVPVLMERIARRDRAVERPLEAAYLDRLVGAYAAFFRRYEAAPVIAVDASRTDFVNDAAALAGLTGEIDALFAQPGCAGLRVGSRETMRPVLAVV